MLKLVVVGHDQDRLSHIKEELHMVHESYPNLIVSSARPGYLEGMIGDNLKLLIFDTQTLNKVLFPFVAQIRKSGFSGCILLLGNPGLNFDISELSQLKDVFHLHKPYQPEQLVGLVKNCLTLEETKQRRFQRFDVREQAVLETYSSDFKDENVINNISKSGARIEGNLEGLRKGDLLRLHFNFDQINKERTMSARVVWVKKECYNKEVAGLEFVSKKAVYQ